MSKDEIINNIIASDKTIKKSQDEEDNEEAINEWADHAIEKSHKWLPHSGDITEYAVAMDDSTLYDEIDNEIDDWLEVVPYAGGMDDESPAQAIVNRLRETGHKLDLNQEEPWKQIVHDESIDREIDGEDFWDLYAELAKKVGFKMEYKTIKEFANSINRGTIWNNKDKRIIEELDKYPKLRERFGPKV